MKVLLLDTNVVSILFKKTHSLRPACLEAVSGQQLVISFMTRAELMLWPVANNWGESRRAALSEHIALYTTLYPDERTGGLGGAGGERGHKEPSGDDHQEREFGPQPGAGAEVL